MTSAREKDAICITRPMRRLAYISVEKGGSRQIGILVPPDGMNGARNTRVKGMVVGSG